MKDLINSNGSWSKVAHYEEIYQMICILCVYVKHHVITEPKNSLAVPSGRFLSKFVQTFVWPLGPWVEHAHRVSFRATSGNLLVGAQTSVADDSHVFLDTPMSS